MRGEISLELYDPTWIPYFYFTLKGPDNLPYFCLIVIVNTPLKKQGKPMPCTVKAGEKA